MGRWGEIAAFGTAVCWTVSALFFEIGSKRIGPLTVNFLKVCIAFILLSITAFFTRGLAFPVDATAESWIYLSLSGFIGFVIADIFLFNAYVLIGSRLTMLFQALSPPLTALIGFFVLGEALGVNGIIGMALVVAGIVVVVVSKKPVAKKDCIDPPDAAKTTPKTDPKTSVKGFSFALLAAVGQAVGVIFTKKGLGNYDFVAGTQIRIITAIIGFAVVALATRKFGDILKAYKNREGFISTSIGAVFGPFIGVALSLFALQNTNAGIASTLIALTPVLIIPPSVIFFKQKVTVFELIGAALAVSGAAVFFL